MKCKNCQQTYIGETEDLRKRMNNAKKDIRNPKNATVPYAIHINKCSKLIEPYFHVYPILYENDGMLRKYKKWQYIKQFKPQLNQKY